MMIMTMTRMMMKMTAIVTSMRFLPMVMPIVVRSRLKAVQKQRNKTNTDLQRLKNEVGHEWIQIQIAFLLEKKKKEWRNVKESGWANRKLLEAIDSFLVPLVLCNNV